MEFAVVGLACEYPGASSPRELWENVLASRRSFRRLPDVRLNAGDYFSDAPDDPDRTYLTRAAVLEGYAFDRVKYRISKATYEQADLAHWLALDVAARALTDAGFDDGEGLPKERTGVVFGNSLTGEFSRANIMRLRWPFVRRVADTVLQELGHDTADRERFMSMMQRAYKAPFPVPDADMLAGGLSNTISGRVTNYFDFGGGCFTVDGACSSSLLAVAEGCRLLATNEWDAALVGGIDLSIDPFEIIGFSRNGALAREEMRVFDRRSEGFWPGEGCGVAVLMRRDEAERRGLQIRAVVRGWGMSSDGHGGLTRPKVETQRVALRRAYQMAGFGIEDVAYFEGHGTGTPVGDEVELRALMGELSEAGAGSNRFVPAVGSIKELIGHTKAAAGIGGFIKACCALERGLLPPGPTTSTPHPLFEESRAVLRRSQEAEPFAGNVMRAGVSSMGFGGINVHVSVESAAPATRSAKALRPAEKRLLDSRRDFELIALAAPTPERLRERLVELRELAAPLSIAELGDLSAQFCRDGARGQHRIAFVVKDAPALVAQIDAALADLDAGGAPATDAEHGRFYGEGRGGRLGFLFPGQGAPTYADPGAARTLLDRWPETSIDPEVAARDASDTARAQPAIMASSLSGLRLLRRFDVEASVAVGHSLGEIAALVWAGVITEQAALQLAAARGRLMSDLGRSEGGMLALRCSLAEAEAMLKGSSSVVACHNGPNDVVVAGDLAALAAVQLAADARNVRAVPLRVSHAFHSPHMEPALPPFRELLAGIEARSPEGTVVSTIAGRPLTANDDIRRLLAAQLVEPVLFGSAIEQCSAIDLWIEVGPGESLKRTMSAARAPVISMDIGSPSLGGPLRAIAAAFALGAPVDLGALEQLRFSRTLEFDRPRSFFMSPCEAVATTDLHEQLTPVENVGRADASQAEELTFVRDRDGMKAALRHFVSAAAEIPSASVKDSDRLLSDLHLNSLTVLEVVASVGRAYSLKDRDFARAVMKVHMDGTLSEISEYLFQALESAEAAQPEAHRETRAIHVDDLPPWVQIFAAEPEPLRVLQPVLRVDAAHDWRAFGASVQEAQSVAAALMADDLHAGSGIVVVASSAGEADLEAFLAAAEAARTREALEHFVLLEVGDSNSESSLAPALRTLSLERPGPSYSVLRVREWDDSVARALKTEASLSRGYREVDLASDGTRSRPVFRPVFFESGVERLGSDDVVLVTGGGKGITFESARRLATRTGAALGLVGRSSPDRDEALKANLAALGEAGIRFSYVASDVCGDELAAAIAELDRTLGPITAVVHGAGTNTPALVAQQNVERFRKTRAPKVQGLHRVLRALEGRPLKMLLTYGSIIAESGMHGELDYALANEELARATEAYAAAHPKCHAVCLEWSVWSGSGMGENLGTIERLKADGVSPMTIEQGLSVLDRVTSASDRLPARLLVASRYGAIPTLAIGKSRRPEASRFLERVVLQTPEVELVSEARLTLESDPYLANHVYRGRIVFPTVMAFEAMAQQVTALVPGARTFTFENVVAQRPILIPETGATTIRIAVARQSADRFTATIRSEDSNFGVDCFRAELVLDAKDEAATWNARSAVEQVPVRIDIDQQLYERVLFHRGDFRRIKAFSAIHRNETVARLEVPSIQPWFGPRMPERLVLGCAGLNDAAIHGHQASVPQYSLLPVSIGRATFISPRATGSLALRTRERTIDSEHVTIDVQIVDEAGALVQAWENMQLRRVKGSDFEGPWPLPLLGSYLEHAVSHIFGDETFRCRLEAHGTTGEPVLDAQSGRIVSAVLPISRETFVGCAQGDVAQALRQINGHAHEGPLAATVVAKVDTTHSLASAAMEGGWRLVSVGDGEADRFAARAFELDSGGYVLCVLAPA